MNERADSASASCEAAYRKRRRSYSAAMNDENSLDDEPAAEDEEEEEGEEEKSYPHRDDATRTGYCRQRECVTRKVSSLESETWSIESLVSKQELTKGFSGDGAKSWSEIEIPELLLAHPEILSLMIRCRCFIPQFSAVCRCAQCQYRRRKISSTSSCFARDSLFSTGTRRKDSGYSASTCQSFLPPSSSCYGGNSAGSLYHGYLDIGDNGAIQRRHSIAAAAPMQHRRYSDQTHSTQYGCQIGRADNRRRLSVQPLAGDAIGNREGAGAASAAEPIIARTYPRGCPEATACATQSAASFHQDANTTAPVDAKAPRGGENTGTHPAKGGKNAKANARRRSSVLTITPKMMRRRFSEQLILEGGLGSVGEFENLADLAEDANEKEESLTAVNARKKITLKRHYYPEGDWGYVIVVITIFVQLISHGLQLASGSLMYPTMTRFEQTAGNSGTTLRKRNDFSGKFICTIHPRPY